MVSRETTKACGIPVCRDHRSVERPVDAAGGCASAYYVYVTRRLGIRARLFAFLPRVALFGAP